MDQILADAGGQLDLLSYDASADLADIDGTNDPTIAVVDSAGITVAGFTPQRLSTGTYRAVLPNNLEVLDVYRATWTWGNGQSRRTEFELIRSHLFTIAELQAYDTDFTDETAYKVSLVRLIRSNVTERSERIANRSFILRGRRLVLDGDGEATLILPVADVQRLVSAKIDGTALTTAELADVRVYPRGTLDRKEAVWTAGKRNVEAFVEYGYLWPPAPVQRAALRLARHLLKANSGQADERATAIFGDFGGYRLTLAGRDGPTGLPEVDEVFREYSLAGTRVG